VIMIAGCNNVNVNVNVFMERKRKVWTCCDGT